MGSKLGSTHCSRPDARHRHIFFIFALKIHRQSFCQHAHSDFSHRICRFSSEKPRVSWRRHNNNSALPSVVSEVRQSCLNCPIQSFAVDFLHQLESFHRRILHARPPDRSRVVDHDVQAPINLDGLLHHIFYASKAPRINNNGSRFAAKITNLPFHSVNCGEGRIWIGWESRANTVGVGRGFPGDNN